MNKEIIKQEFAKAKAVINQPKAIFTKLEKSTHFKPHIKYLVFLWIVGSILATLGSVLFGYLLPLILASITKQSFSLPVPMPQYILGNIISTLISIVMGLILSALGSLLLHVWIRIFQGKGSFLRSFQLNTYAMTPSMLFGWVPIASILASFYGVYLLLVGANILHGISMKKGIIMFIILPIVVSVAIALLLPYLGITLPQAG